MREKRHRYFFVGLAILSSLYLFGSEVEKVIEGISLFKGHQYSLKPLSGGLTNRIYRIDDLTNHEIFVLRIGGQDATHLGIDPVAQVAITKRAGELQIGPALRYVSSDKTIVLVDFANGRPLSRKNYNNEIMRNLVKKLRVLHGSGEFKTTFDLFATAFAFREGAKKQSGAQAYPWQDIDKASKIMAKIQVVLKPYEGQFIGSAHNDFHGGNILIDGQNNVSIIDWDYAGKADIFIDLATMADDLDLTEKESEELLQAYFAVSPNDLDPNHLAHLGMMRLVSCYWNAMWYFFQVGSSSIEHDYLASGKARLKRFLQNANAPSYQKWFSQLQIGVAEGF